MYNRCSTPNDVEETISADMVALFFIRAKITKYFLQALNSKKISIGFKTDKLYLSALEPINVQ